MKITKKSTLAVLLCLCGWCWGSVSAVNAQTQPVAAPRENLGRLHHPISTKSREAQRLFNEGLTLVYGFNHEEAIHRFERAAALDPGAAMPLWGIALALGPNINLDVDPERERLAYEATQKALAKVASAPENERAYIAALAKRYSNDPQADLKRLAAEYAAAMRELSRRYPEDLDAATLFADSLMNLHPWQLWTLDGRPTEDTEEIMAVIESVLRREPQHVGANHYYVHTMEASLHPEAALPSAQRLETLVPAAGHLVHMPAHIYQRTGDYFGAALANARGAAADRAYLARSPSPGPGGHSLYGMMYYSHNLYFQVASLMMDGQLAPARQAAARLAAYVRPGLQHMPMVEAFLLTPVQVELRFAEWARILALPAPDAKLVMSSYFWHYARGMAFAATSHPDQARAERALLETLRKDVPPGPAFGMLFNDATVLAELAALSLDARIALAGGDRAAAIASLRAAVALQDSMRYNEPEEWHYPIRESLGAALLLDGRSSEAETVFRQDLDRHPRNPRSLFGLWQALLAQEKSVEADFVHRQFLTAWKRADVTPRLADF